MGGICDPGPADRFASLKIQLLPDGPLPWLARSLEGTDAVNLRQGEFAPAATGGGWRKWRTAGALAAGLLAVHMAADAVQLRHGSDSWTETSIASWLVKVTAAGAATAVPWSSITSRRVSGKTA